MITIPSAILLLHFDEPNGVSPADALGNLDDLGGDVGVIAPLSVDAFTGAGRGFRQANPNALIAGDASSLGTMLPRDASIQALITIALTGAAGPQTVIARGIHDGSAPERYAYGLQVQEQAGNPGYVEIAWFWEDSAGNVITAPPGVFRHAGDTTEIMLTATRRWEAIDRVVVRYYVDRRCIGELVSTSGDISGGVTGTTTIGGRKNAGAWEHFLNADLDELAVFDYELSAEEVAQTFDRLTIHQPAGLASFAGLAPPGLPWTEDPSTDIAKRAKVIGHGIGLLTAAIEELRACFLPAHCPAWLLPRWESLYGLAPGPLDSLDVRRARVIARMSADEGYSIPALMAAFAPVFGLDSSAVQMIEYANEWSDSLDTEIAPERWTSGDVGTWSVVNGQLVLAVPNGTNIPPGPTPNPCHLWTPIDRGADDDPGNEFDEATISVTFVDVSDVPAATLQTSLVGMCLHNRVGNRTLWIGLHSPDGVARQLGYREGTAAGGLGAFTSVAAAPANGPLWIRVRTVHDGTLVISWSTTGPSAGWTSASATAFGAYNIAGLGMTTDAALASAVSVRFDDFIAWTPGALRQFCWFAFRDPTLPGFMDMIGAQLLARVVSPAHMIGAACASKSLLMGDPVLGLVGTTPMGAF